MKKIRLFDRRVRSLDLGTKIDALRALAESNFESRENYVAAQDVAGGMAGERADLLEDSQRALTKVTLAETRLCYTVFDAFVRVCLFSRWSVLGPDSSPPFLPAFEFSVNSKFKLYVAAWTLPKTCISNKLHQKCDTSLSRKKRFH